MSLASGNDSGQRRWSVGAWFGIASLIPGVLVAIVSVRCTLAALDAVRTPSTGGDPQGGVASGIALTYATLIGGPIILLGCIFALVGLSQPPRRWGVIGLALNAGCPLLCYAIYLVLSPSLRPPPPPPIPRVPPSAFFGWCRDNNFGVSSPVVSSKFETNADPHPYLFRRKDIGRAELSVKTPCKTEEEAKAFVEAAIGDLQAAAKERGISLSVERTYADPPGHRMGNGSWERIVDTTCKYQSGPIIGVLFVNAEWRSTGTDGKPGKEYSVQFSVFESYHGPE